MNENKIRVQRLYEEIDKGNLDIVDECFSTDYVDHNLAIPGLAPGLKGAKQAFEIFHAAFPDTVHVIEDLISEGDKVVARIRASGTHTGELMGRPATGRLVKLTGIAIYRFDNGRIVERWAEEAGGGVLPQLALIPTSDVNTFESC
jgi:predicted ester cyclase